MQSLECNNLACLRLTVESTIFQATTLVKMRWISMLISKPLAMLSSRCSDVPLEKPGTQSCLTLRGQEAFCSNAEKMRTITHGEVQWEDIIPVLTIHLRVATHWLHLDITWASKSSFPRSFWTFSLRSSSTHLQDRMPNSTYLSLKTTSKISFRSGKNSTHMLQALLKQRNLRNYSKKPQLNVKICSTFLDRGKR